MRVLASRRRLTLALAALLAAPLVGCGASAPTRAPGWHWLHHTWIRGAPAVDTPPRAALTFDGPSACTDALLTALAERGAGGEGAEGAEGARATFFIDADRLDAAAERDPAATTATLRRLVGEGHGLGVALGGGEGTVRARLDEQTRRITARLEAAGIEPPALRPWRGADGAWQWADAEAAPERPRVMYSFSPAPGVPIDRWLPALVDGVRDGDIIALPGGEGAACPMAAALPSVLTGLAAAGLEPVTVQALLSREFERYAAPRLVRYRGEGLAAGCAEALDLAPGAESGGAEPGGAEPGERWGLVHRPLDDAVVVMPLPGAAGSTTGLLAERRLIDDLWRTRARWSGLPACLRRVPLATVDAPLAAPDDVGAWWVVGDGAPERRSRRAIGSPTAPAVLPDRADLARFEVRQRVPFRWRGVVADALERLGLDTPLLVELRGTAAVVIGEALTPTQAADRVAVRRAIAGVVPVAELTMGEYLFLAETVPSEAEVFRRTARSADGFLRPGPYLTLSAPGRAPDPGRLYVDDRRPLVGVDALVARVLAAGHALAPGDVVAAAPPAPRGAPIVFPTTAGESMAAALRTGLARSLLLAMMLPVYLRPGAVRPLDGAELGVQWVRLAVPAGVDAPATEARPLVEPAGARPTEEDAR